MVTNSVVILGNVPEVSGCDYTELRQTKSGQIDSNKGPKSGPDSSKTDTKEEGSIQDWTKYGLQWTF